MAGRFFPFLKRPPSIAAFILALIVVGAGYLINTYGVVEPLSRFTVYLGESLRSFDAFNVSRTVYFEITGCELKRADGIGFAVTCDPGGDKVVCEPSADGSLSNCKYVSGRERETGFFASLFLALVNTTAALWSGSTWLGIVIYAVALVSSGIWLARRMKPEGEPAFWLVWILLVPAVASIAALGLHLLLLLFTLLFSKALAGIVWILATFGGAIAWFKASMQVFSTAHRIDTLGENVGSEKRRSTKE